MCLCVNGSVCHFGLSHFLLKILVALTRGEFFLLSFSNFHGSQGMALWKCQMGGFRSSAVQSRRQQGGLRRSLRTYPAVPQVCRQIPSKHSHRRCVVDGHRSRIVPPQRPRLPAYRPLSQLWDTKIPRRWSC